MSGQRTARRHYLLRSLNFFGLDHLDPIMLAALADGQPLLLIGAHGTAKSELLYRIAAALGLAHRHYNASLISFDEHRIRCRDQCAAVSAVSRTGLHRVVP